MHRFFVTLEEIQSDEIRFSAITSRQIARVLRLKPGDQVTVLDNSGYEMLTELEQVDESICTGRVIQKEHCSTEPHCRLLMILSLTQREKFEWMLQKCTEVGAAAFLPMITSRSLVQKPADVLTKYPRWKMILKEAAEQSGRGIIPEILEPASFEEVLKTVPSAYSMCLMPWEDEHQISLHESLRGAETDKVALMIGPEGGFSAAEVEKAERAGFKPVTLGKRVLRMETAAMVAAALVLHEVEKD